MNILKKLILIIDDSQDNQDLLKLLFSARGHEVLCTHNGIEALAILQELSHLPDLIFLDARMPIMDGYQFRIEQKKNPRLKDIPVVIMSGDNEAEMNEKMIYPEKVLVKPLNIKSIVESCAPYFN